MREEYLSESGYEFRFIHNVRPFIEPSGSSRRPSLTIGFGVLMLGCVAALRVRKLERDGAAMQPPRPLAIPIGHLSPVISITTLPPNVSRLSPNVSRQGPGRFGITPR